MKFLFFSALLLFCQAQIFAAPSKQITKELSFSYFDNKIPIPDNTFNFTFGDVVGQLTILNTDVRGLPTLTIKGELDPVTGNSSTSISSTGELGISGNYELLMEGTISNGFYLTIAGNGPHDNWIRKLNIGHQGNLADGASGFVEISDLKIILDFEEIELGVYGLTLNGYNMDWIWPPCNFFLNNYFKDIWAQIEVPVTQLITQNINAFFLEQQLTFQEVVDIILGRLE